MLVGVATFFGSEVVLAPFGYLLVGWVLVGVAAVLGSEAVLAPCAFPFMCSAKEQMSAKIKVHSNPLQTICRNHSFPSEFTLFGVYAGVIQTMTIYNFISPLTPGHGHAAYASLGMFGNWNGVFVKELQRHTFGRNSALKSFDGSWLKAICWAARTLPNQPSLEKNVNAARGLQYIAKKFTKIKLHSISVTKGDLRASAPSIIGACWHVPSRSARKQL